MGSVCCVAAAPQDSSLNNGRHPIGPQEPHWQINGGVSSPVYSHWESKLQAKGNAVAMNTLNGGGSRVGSSYFTRHQGTLSGSVPNEENPSNSFQLPKSLNSSIPKANSGDFVHATSDLTSSPPMAQAFCQEGGHSVGSSTVFNSPNSPPPYLSTLDFSSARSKSQPSSSHHHTFGSNMYFSRHPYHNSRHLLSRQTSDSQIHARNPISSSPIPLSEGRHSFKLSGSSGDSTMGSHGGASDWWSMQTFKLSGSSGDSTMGSHGGASDWWSMQTFSDLVASSRRERLQMTDASSPSDFGWVPSRESIGRAILAAERLRNNNSQAASLSSAVDPQVCGICLKLLTQRSPWSAQKVIASNELSVIAVLVCGHVYHAECLEQKTPKASQQDPPCPICVASENLILKRQKSAEQVVSCRGSSSVSASQGQYSRNKLSRIGVANDDMTESEILPGLKFSGKKDCLSSDNGPSLSSSSSGKSFLNKSFSRRHFFLRGKSVKNPCMNDSFYKGFSERQQR